jgi:hypothetical protein
MLHSTLRRARFLRKGSNNSPNAVQASPQMAPMPTHGEWIPRGGL